MMLANQYRCFASPMKLSNSNFLKRELMDNPEFFKAFPHLAPAEYREETAKMTDAYREAPFF
jgi:hypothetical protein